MGDIEKLNTCLAELGGLRLDTLVERKLLQKRIYFLQEFGVDLGYSFGFHVYGPYSPELTEDAYFLKRQMEQAPDTLERSELSSSEQDALTPTIKFLVKYEGDEVKTAYWLELLSSLHFLWNFSYIKDKTKEKVFNRLIEKKRIRNPDDLETAWTHLAKYGLVS